MRVRVRRFTLVAVTLSGALKGSSAGLEGCSPPAWGRVDLRFPFDPDSTRGVRPVLRKGLVHRRRIPAEGLPWEDFEEPADVAAVSGPPLPGDRLGARGLPCRHPTPADPRCGTEGQEVLGAVTPALVSAPRCALASSQRGRGRSR